MLLTQLIDDIHSRNKSSEKIIVKNPASQKKIAELPCNTPQEIADSIRNSKTGFDEWQHTPAAVRATLLNAWADLITKHEEEIATLITQEAGKPLKESKTEVSYAKSFITWFSSLITESPTPYETSIPPLKSHISWRPIGPVYAITPWNFPAAMITRKVAPALAAGCSVILKPSEHTPLSALILHQLALQAGIPQNVFQIILENDPNLATTPMMESHDIRKITFTGSTRIGKKLFSQASETLKRMSLELGGNAPFIVFESADINIAIQSLIAAKFRNAGQTCVSPNRIFVHKNIYTPFINKLCCIISKLSVGDGMQNHDVGPLINQNALSKVEHHVKDALEKGATLHIGGQVHQKDSLFYTPTVLSDMTDDMLAFQEETFGPVVSISPFSTLKEVIERANNTPFGLASYIVSENENDIEESNRTLETGMLAINTGKVSHAHMPFGGVKQSGIGREGGQEGLFEFLETHTATMPQNTSSLHTFI